MTTTAIELTRPQDTDTSAGEEPPIHCDVTADEWRDIVRALATGTDENELPLFGRLPG